MKNVDMSFWRQDEKLQSVATRGFNHLQEIPRLITTAHPEFRDWKFGFCNKDSLPLWRADKWIHVQPHHFPEMDDFNREIAGRFRLHEKDGVIMYKTHYLMMMPVEFRKELIKARQEASKEDLRSVLTPSRSRGSDGSVTETTIEQKEITVPGKKKT